ncbi:hypothetical protein NDU88_003526 [Pleurodeles waltl]|uniref:Uncharacterized protein n=1 Tax=Pleurodeles waltl TaxID=8319 RepID=A0AAV7RGH6_PLEWA|nr:hypothetical protein NDU88_003526 [Pleurodeles waltl]
MCHSDSLGEYVPLEKERAASAENRRGVEGNRKEHLQSNSNPSRGCTWALPHRRQQEHSPQGDVWAHEETGDVFP